MDIVIGLVIGLILGGAAVGAIVHFRVKSQVVAAQTTAKNYLEMDVIRGSEMERLRETLAAEQRARVTAETQRTAAQVSLDEQRATLDKAKEDMANAFKALAAEALQGNREQFAAMARERIETLLARSEGKLGEHQQAVKGLVDPLRQALDRYEKQVQELERKRAGAYGSLEAHLKTLGQAQDILEKQTTSLVHALRSPGVRGKWGELTLQRLVELAGMAEHCDFETQATTGEAEDRQRPDMIIHLPGNRTIIVDSKVPLASYLDATEAPTEKERLEKMQSHAKAVRDRMKELSLKSYWGQFAAAPEYVVLFMPGESFFSAAVELDRELIADGIRNRVILATPTTLIMALLTVAHSWQQQQLAENAERIAEAGKGLFDSLCVFVRHLGDIGAGLHKASDSYNKTIGSWEHNVEPKARRLKELGAAKPDQDLPELDASEIALRQLPPGEGKPAGTTDA